MNVEKVQRSHLLQMQIGEEREFCLPNLAACLSSRVTVTQTKMITGHDYSTRLNREACSLIVKRNN